MSRRSHAPGAETLAGIIVGVIVALIVAGFALVTRQVAQWWFYHKLGGMFGIAPRRARSLMKRIAK